MLSSVCLHDLHSCWSCASSLDARLKTRGYARVRRDSNPKIVRYFAIHGKRNLPDAPFHRNHLAFLHYFHRRHHRWQTLSLLLVFAVVGSNETRKVLLTRREAKSLKFSGGADFVTKVQPVNTLLFLATLQTVESFNSCVDYVKIRGDGINSSISLWIAPAIKTASSGYLPFVNTVRGSEAERLTINLTREKTN